MAAAAEGPVDEKALHPFKGLRRLDHVGQKNRHVSFFGLQLLLHFFSSDRSDNEAMTESKSFLKALNTLFQFAWSQISIRSPMPTTTISLLAWANCRRSYGRRMRP